MSATCLLQDRQPGGFSFANCHRNRILESKGINSPKPIKTGTTICGVVFKNGVILAADTRATEGNIVADKCCEKIHYIAKNIYCCGAGVAADTEMTTRMVSSQVELHRLSTGRSPRVIVPLRLIKQYLFQYEGHVGASLILGGVDFSGPHLYSVAPHGSSDKLPYLTMGSGSLAAMSVLESRYRFDMEKEEAVKLARDAIAAGIFNDLGSGSNVDMCIITPAGVEYSHPYEVANEKGKRAGHYNAPPGSTAVLKQQTRNVEFDVVSTRVIRDLPAPDAEAMDLL